MAISTAILAVLLIGGIVFASTTKHSVGTATPIAQTTYTFEVYTAQYNTIVLPETGFFDFGSVSVDTPATKTVWLQKTGTGNVTVTPNVSNLDATGQVTFSPTSVSLTSSTRQSITVTYTALAAGTADTFDINFVGNP